jgi:transposase
VNVEICRSVRHQHAPISSLEQDPTDAEWAIAEPVIPPARHGGRRRSSDVRDVLNGIFHILWTGWQWKALPKDLPPHRINRRDNTKRL